MQSISITRTLAMCVALTGAALLQSSAPALGATGDEIFFDGFEPNVTLTVGTTGAGGGTITSSPTGIDCGPTCSHDYDVGTIVTLTATPAAGSGFGGWSNPCLGTGVCMVTMDAAKSVSAAFAGPAVSITVTQFPSVVTAGVLSTFTVTAEDASATTATGYIGTVHFTSTDSQAVLPADYTFTASDAGQKVNFSATLKTAGTQSITATDTVTGTITGTQSSISVNPAAAAILSVAGFPTTPTAGVAGSYSVTARDAFFNAAPGYRGTVRFTSSDPQAVLPADYTFTASDAGQKVNFSATLKTAGTQSITATDIVTGTITGTQSGISVNPAAAAILSVAGFPTTQTAGVTGSYSVTAMDAFFNTASGYTGTVHFASSDSAAVLPSDYTFLPSDFGQKAGLLATLKTAGPSKSITATDTASASITGAETGIHIYPGPTFKLVVTGFPTTQTSGAAGSFTVTAMDAFFNATPGYRGTVHFTSSDPAAVLPPDYTFQTSDFGQKAGLSATLKTAGYSQSITATDTASASITGAETGIQIYPGPTFKLVVTGFPSPTFSGVPGPLTVTAKDAQGNVTPAYAGTVGFSSTNAAPSLPPNYAFVPGDAGMHVFANTHLDAVSVNSNIVATDQVSSGITGSESNIVVAQGPNLFGLTATEISGGPHDGEIFVAGGSIDPLGSNLVTNTWFYNPVTSSLSAGPDLSIPRAFHTATALPGTGKIVVAGGEPSGFYRLFELCDLSVLNCNRVGDPVMVESRCHAAAALVSSTRILAAGGDDCAGTPLSSWEIWDSTDPSHTISGSMTTARRLLTATSLGNGKVLLAGGAATATADLFTDGGPPTSVLTTGGMIGVRSGHTATVIGGSPCTLLSAACVLIAGGDSTIGQTWEIYDPSTNTFPRNATTAGTDLVNPKRAHHAAAAFFNGKVLLAGGNDGSDLKTTEVIDASGAGLSFVSGTPLLITRAFGASAYSSSQNTLFLFGGNVSGPAFEQAPSP